MQVTISGTPVTIVPLSLNISDAIGQRSVATFTVLDNAGAFHFLAGQPVTILNDAGLLLYSGSVFGAKRATGSSYSNLLLHQVTCQDQHYPADKRIAATSYASQTCGFMANDLLTNWLAAEGIYAVRNLLTANQSSWETDTTGATLVGGSLHVTLTADSAQAWRGTKSLKTVTDGAFTFQGVQIQCPVANFLPGGTYTFSAMLRASTGTPTVRFYVQSDTSNVGSVPSVVLSSTGWVRYTITVTLPTSFAGLTFFALKWDTGGATQALTVYMDGCQIEPNWAASNSYPVTNLYSALQSDFEGTDLIPVNQGTSFLVSLGVSGGASRDTAQAWHGAASLKCISDGSGSFQSLSVNLPTSRYVLGATYTFSLWIKAQSGTPTLRIFTEGNDLNPGNSAIGTVSSYTLSTSWQRITWQVTMPGSWGVFTYVGIRIDTGGTLATTFWIDGLQIEAGNAASDWVLGSAGALTSYQPGSVWELGGTSTIQAGPLVTSYVVNYKPVSTALDDLAKLAGFYWVIDQYKRLTFAAQSTYTSPFIFDGTQALDGSTFVEDTSPLYRNAQYELGGTEVTSAQTETQKGDGSKRVFQTSFPIHSVPSNIHIDAGAAQTVGILGVDTGKQWYWNKGIAQVTQDNSGTVLTSANVLSITYVGEYKVIAYASDTAQQLAEQAVEGGAGVSTGIVENVVADASLITASQAFQNAAALLAKYATSGQILTFRTKTPGLAAGQLLTVNLPSPPWSFTGQQVLIESVTITYDDFFFWWDVKALSGPVNSNWVQFFQALADTQTPIDLAASGGLQQSVAILAAFTMAFTWAMTYTATVFACPICGPSTLCAPTLICC